MSFTLRAIHVIRLVFCSLHGAQCRNRRTWRAPALHFAICAVLNFHSDFHSRPVCRAALSNQVCNILIGKLFEAPQNA
jgi:hypothetical protein